MSVICVFEFEMHDDPGILCFQHCDRNARTFCLEIPETCPVCNASLKDADLRIPPFRIPFPFVSAQKAPCSIVIRPTLGDFLHNYQNSSDLHIGVTDSKGDVHEFDRQGLSVGLSQNWTQCLAVPIITKLDAMWKEYWDYTLYIVRDQDRWQPERYEAEGHNCYTFVLSFLRTLQINELKPSLSSKTQFCKDFIVPRTKNVAKYIILYRQIIKDRVKVQCY